MKDLLKWFLEGMGTITVFPSLPDVPQRSDAESIALDWQCVGDEIRKAAKNQ